jgi:cytosine/adenosine deaminase-related metal-dependent hydrolase
MRTLIRGAWVVGFENGHHVLLRDGVVVMEDDRILHVGQRFAGQVDRTLDAPDKLVAPGFVDAHALTNVDIQTLALDVRTEDLASARDHLDFGTFELDEEHLRAGARYALTQLLKGGSTTIVASTQLSPGQLAAPRAEAPLLAQLAGELGARIYVAHQFRAGVRRPESDADSTHWNERAAATELAYAREVVEQLESSHADRVRTMLFPSALDACTPALLREVKAAAHALDVPVHIRAAQTLAEFHACMRRYNRTPVQLLDEAGFLGERTLLAHLNYTTAHPASGFPMGDDRDLEIVARRGATVVHCPVVDARRGHILASFSRFGGAGINLALGTAAHPPDMFEEMRWAALGAKWQDRDANAGTARAVFDAATLGGAQALGRPDLGRLAHGAKADLLLVDLETLSLGPVDDPIRNLVYAGDAGHIRTVFVDGHIVVVEGRIPGLDERGLQQAATAAYLRQCDRIAEHRQDPATAATLFPTVYPEV